MVTHCAGGSSNRANSEEFRFLILLIVDDEGAGQVRVFKTWRPRGFETAHCRIGGLSKSISLMFTGTEIYTKKVTVLFVNLNNTMTFLKRESDLTKS